MKQLTTIIFDLDVIVTGEDITRTTADPEPYLAALSRPEVSPEWEKRID